MKKTKEVHPSTLLPPSDPSASIREEDYLQSARMDWAEVLEHGVKKMQAEIPDTNSTPLQPKTPLEPQDKILHVCSSRARYLYLLSQDYSKRAVEYLTRARFESYSVEEASRLVHLSQEEDHKCSSVVQSFWNQVYQEAGLWEPQLLQVKEGWVVTLNPKNSSPASFPPPTFPQEGE